MTIQLARRIGRALDVSSESKIREIDEAIRGYVRAVPQAVTTTSTSIPTATPADLKAATETAGRLISPATLADSINDHAKAMAYFLGT